MYNIAKHDNTVKSKFVRNIILFEMASNISIKIMLFPDILYIENAFCNAVSAF